MLSPPLRLLLDECRAAKELAKRLRERGHDVRTAVECVGAGASDHLVFAFAKQDGRTLLTANCSDFLALHENDRAHFGILLIYQDNDGRDMSFGQIVEALDLASHRLHGQVAGRIVILNHFRS